MISHIVSTFSRKPVFGYLGMAYAMVAIGIVGFAKDGKSDIYTMDLENRLVERITNHPSIDTSPSYSPNGKFIAFKIGRASCRERV